MITIWFDIYQHTVRHYKWDITSETVLWDKGDVKVR